MQKKFAITGAALAMLAVILGAFAAHGLRTQVSEIQVGNFETGVRYQFMHALALLILAFNAGKLAPGAVRTAAWSWIIGILFFSGSLYLLACRDLLDIRHWTWVGPITPIGGVFFIFGWGFLIWAIVRSPASE